MKQCFTNVTSYCCIHRRIELGTAIFGGTQEFLHVYPHHTDTVMDTVSYFDVNNMVSLLKVPTVFCLCLSDPICLPEFVYSAYAHADCEKALYMYPFWQHQLPPAHKLLVHNEFAKLQQINIPRIAGGISFSGIALILLAAHKCAFYWPASHASVTCYP